MVGALLILAVTVVVGALLWWFDRRRKPGCAHRRVQEQTAPARPAAHGGAGADGECCGMHAVCEKKMSLSPTDTEIVYYDDEELDIYRGRDPEMYTSAEREQFRDVLLTLLPADVPGWARSLQLRGIPLPPDVRDELLLIVSEQRPASV